MKGFVVVGEGGHLGYGEYTYFVLSRDEAENILEDVRSEHPEMRVVPAVLLIGDEVPSR